MPLYSDSNYYYSGGSSQLYSPYYTSGLYSSPSTSVASNSYTPYSSTYNRTFGGSYIVPLAPPRTPSYTTNSLSPRYQPKLSTITEIGASRHTSLIPLTRIHSPKISSYSTPHTPTLLPKYTPQRPIHINTADIDVSASRYHNHKDEALEEARKKQQAEEAAAAAAAAAAKKGSPTKRDSIKKTQASKVDDVTPSSKSEKTESNVDPDEHKNRSTIKRNRAVVRLSTIRSRNKDRSSKSTSSGTEESSSPDRKLFRDLPEAPPLASEEKLSWRQKLADDLAAIPVYPARKSPGDIIRERYFIQDAAKGDVENESATRRAARYLANTAASSTEVEEIQAENQVLVELDPVDLSIRRLSLPKCPTFHDICEDISSDKIDDDLNAGQLRRRASLIQEQEQEILNQLQKSASGTFQMIHLERQESHGSLTDDSVSHRSSKRKSKKGKKIRHKITAVVDIENAATTLLPILQEKEEDWNVPAGKAASKPKFTFNVESVEEHEELNKIFKLPKKKSVKRKSLKSKKNVPLPEGFMQAKPKIKIESPTKAKAPKKETFVNTAEIFTFDKASVDISKAEEEKKTQETNEMKEKIYETPEILIAEQTANTAKTPTLLKTAVKPKTPTLLKTADTPKTPTVVRKIEQLRQTDQTFRPLSPKTKKTESTKESITKHVVEASHAKVLEKTKTPALQTAVSLDSSATKISKPNITMKPFEKSQSFNVEDIKFSVPQPLKYKLEPAMGKPIVEEIIVDVKKSNFVPTTIPNTNPFSLTSSTALDSANLLEKAEGVPKPSVATPKPIRKIMQNIQKSDSGEDFWTQIGSRETLYMTNRKKNVLESQWQKREDLLESQTTENVKNLEEIKTVITAQKEDALQKAEDNVKGLVGRSNSNESKRSKNGSKEIHTKEEKKVEEDLKKIENVEKTEKKISPKKKSSPLKVISPKQNVDLLKESTTKSKTEIDKTTTTMAKTTPTVVAQTTAIEKAAAAATKTAELSTSSKTPKINTGQEAKSPEQQQNKFTTTTSDSGTNDCSGSGISISSSNKDKEKTTPINNAMTTTATTSSATSNNAVAKNVKLATSTATIAPTTLPATASVAALSINVSTSSEATTAAAAVVTATAAAAAATEKKQQQQETKAKKLTEADKKINAALKSPIDTVNAASDKTKLPTTAAATAKQKVATATGKTSKISPTNAKNKKTSPSTQTATATINVDQFFTVAPAKTTTSPTKMKNASPKTTTVAPAMPTNAAATNNAKTKTTLAQATIASTPTLVATTAITTTTLTTKTPTDTAETSTTAATGTAASTAVAIALSDDNSGNSNSNTRACNNLSKFATVSNLAQYLQDVDAEPEDYIPSSADDSNDNFSDDDSSFDYSSVNGWDKLSASMKKKIRRQHRKKEKEAEKARFDPQKKIKIDPTNKCYVKDEAPRYPLVATPRPLWKREKIVYPDEDSDDDSDSDDSGSTEETEDSEECTTSEEYEDDLNATTTSSGVGSGGGAGSDGGGSGSGTGGATGGDSSSPSSKENSSIIRMSTCSNDSGFEGGTAPSSPKKMLECDVNCHKKCERLTANLCGVNQKLIVEALACVKRGARETRDSPTSTPPSSNPAYKIDANDEYDETDETSYTYSQFQKSGRFTAPATVIPRFKNYTVDDFHFLAVLGKGSFGKVLLAELRDTTYYYAVKCLKKDVVLEDDDVDSTLIERKVLALGTKHPYLCHLFCTFQTESHLFFVMEYLNGGDLMFHIQESGRFSEERARFYGAEIISGLKFLHKKGIIYRDLKLDNVLLDYEGHVRIADFGMCKLQIYLDKTADSFCGTPDYMAPEIVKGEKYNQNVDWWSFGVLLYEMLIGQSPFSGCDEDELFWSICNEIPWFPVYISAEATGILKGLLEKDYTKRIGSQYSLAGDISDHIFFFPIDWNLLEKRQMEPPFKPQVKHPLDTQYFDRVFTRERVRLTPIDKEILQSMDQKPFHGFTYTNPHITLD